jgi:hypothetical protein
MNLMRSGRCDAATGTVVLFGGHGRHRFDNGTFTRG